jgi:uncharacterized membrane-anchored protein
MPAWLTLSDLYPTGERSSVNTDTSHRPSKVPQVTWAFWLIKIAATTLGETGGDALSMSLDVGYAISTLIFFGLFLIAVAAQIRARAFHRFLYWAVIVATTTAGTTLADFADRSLGIGYLGGSAILLGGVVAALAAWRLTAGSVSVERIDSPKVEAFYWTTILLSNTLGTALGDFLADSGPGYEGGAIVFSGSLAIVPLAVLAGGGAVLIGGVVVLVLANGADADLQAKFTPDKKINTITPEDALAETARISGNYKIGWALTGVGVVGAGVGAWMQLRQPKGKVAVAPTLGGAMLTARF